MELREDFGVPRCYSLAGLRRSINSHSAEPEGLAYIKAGLFTTFALPNIMRMGVSKKKGGRVQWAAWLALKCKIPLNILYGTNQG